MAQSSNFSNINTRLPSPLSSPARRTLPCPLPFVSSFLNYRALPLTVPQSFVLRQVANSRSYGAVGPIRATAGSSGSQIKESIETEINENPVVVYSKTWCPYCQQAKGLFEDLGVEPYVVELDELGAAERHVQNALEGLTGQSTVPNVFIGGKHIGGCSDTMELHQNGELIPLLSAAGVKVA